MSEPRKRMEWTPLYNDHGKRNLYGWRSDEFDQGDGPMRFHIHRDTYRQPSRRSRKDNGREVFMGWSAMVEYLDGNQWIMGSVKVAADAGGTNFSNIRTAKKACEIYAAHAEVSA